MNGLKLLIKDKRTGMGAAPQKLTGSFYISEVL